MACFSMRQNGGARKMAVKTKDNLDEVRKEVYESMYIHLNEIMKDAASDIENHFESVVDMWYEAYDPKYYNRTYDTFYASSAFNSGFDPTHSVSSNRPLDKNYKVTKTDDGFEAVRGFDFGSAFSCHFLPPFLEDVLVNESALQPARTILAVACAVIRKSGDVVEAQLSGDLVVVIKIFRLNHKLF